MKFVPTPISGCLLVSLDPRNDQRGSFTRLFCADAFAAQGLVSHFVQISESSNIRRGTLRGMHYQLAPHQEVKMIRCLKGAIYDVALDLRPDSPTFGQSFGAQLEVNNWSMMYIPRGCAHGFISLTDDSALLYMISDFHTPSAERGVRYNDPKFKIQWPLEPVEMSDKDRQWPDFDPAFHLGTA